MPILRLPSPRTAAIPVVATCLAALLSVPGAATGGEEEAERGGRLALLRGEARRRSASGDYEGALEQWKRYLSLLPRREVPLEPRRARAWLGMARVHTALDRKERAFEALERAVRHGLWNPELLRRDSRLETLRDGERFAGIVESSRNGPARMAVGRRTLEGKVLRAAELEGKVLIIDVWGTWCRPCREELPHLIELQREYREHGLRVIGVAWERRAPSDAVRAQVRGFAEIMGINYPCVLADEELLEAAAIQAYPTTFFVDHEGRIARRFRGYRKLRTLETQAVRLLNRKILAERRRAEGDAPKDEDPGDGEPPAPPDDADPPAEPGDPAPGETPSGHAGAGGGSEG